MQENFLVPMIYIKPLLVGYLEINGIFSFDKMVPGYVKTVMDSPALPMPISFLNNHSRMRYFYRSRLHKTTTSGAGETKSGIYIRQ